MHLVFLVVDGLEMTHLMSLWRIWPQKRLKIAIFEKSIVSNEDNIKNVSGYNFFQLPFWAKIFYRCNNQALEISLNPQNLKCEQLLIPKFIYLWWPGAVPQPFTLLYFISLFFILIYFTLLHFASFITLDCSELYWEGKQTRCGVGGKKYFCFCEPRLGTNYFLLKFRIFRKYMDKSIWYYSLNLRRKL